MTENDANPNPSAATLRQRAEAKLTTDPLRVLLIEDDPDDVLLLKETLAETSAVKIKLVHADCLSEGVKRTAEQEPDVILLDLNLPDSRGLDTLSSLRRQAPTMPIVVLSGLADEVIALDAIRLGAQDYLVKGEISVPLLVRVLRYAIERKQLEQVIRKSEETYRLILNGIDEIVYQVSQMGDNPLDGIFEFVSEQTQEILGYRPIEFYTNPQRWVGLIHPDDIPIFKDQTKNIITTGFPGIREYRMKDTHGEYRWLEDRVVQQKDDKNRITRLFGVARDITERKRAEESLRVSEIRYRRLFEVAHDGILILDAATGMIVDVNPFLIEMLGYSREQFLGRKVWELGFFKDIIANQFNLLELQQKEFIRYEDMPLETINGERLEVEFVSNVYRVDGQKVIQCNIRDITERKRAENKMREQAALLDLAKDAILVRNMEGEVVFWSRGAEQTYGWMTAEASGQATHTLLSTVFPLAREALEETLLTDGRWDGELTHTRRDGTQIVVASRQVLQRDERGQPIGILEINRDITERKRAEEVLIIANAELVFQNEEKEKRAAELVVANAELAFQNEEKEKRAAELIIANAELAAQNEEKEKRAAELIIANAELAAQNEEKEKRAAELIVANKELLFQNEEKEKRAAELVVANKELLFQNEEKEKRAAELVVANAELAIQNEEKEKRAAELSMAQVETVRRLRNIEALRVIDQAISGSLDLRLTLSIVLEQVISQLNVDAAAVLLLNPHTQTLEYAAGRGFRSKAIEKSRLRLGEGLPGRNALESRIVSVTDLRANDAQFARALLLAGEEFVTYSGAPLIAKGQVNGVLEVYLRTQRTVDDEWLNFLETLAGQVAIAVDSASLFTGLQNSNRELFNAFDSTIEGWSHAMDLRDKETENHTQRVTEMTLKLARAAGIPEAELVHVRRGALLHDIGKIGVPDGILLKPDKLTDEEWVVMRKHPVYAFEFLSPIAYLRSALDIPYCHHEKWDGSGYPRGLKGEQIPRAARLFSIVDIWDALTSDRPYRKAWEQAKVIEYIKSLSGTHLEPKAVELFLKVKNEDTQGAG